MTYLLDGPGAGQKLKLKRTPIFLRVVVSKEGKWDALDQVDDEPAPDESIYVYRIRNYDGTKLFTKAGVFPKAEYGMVDKQPADAYTRTNKAWKEWTEMEGRKLTCEIRGAKDGNYTIMP